jgi:hypothetical protein
MSVQVDAQETIRRCVIYPRSLLLFVCFVISSPKGNTSMPFCPSTERGLLPQHAFCPLFVRFGDLGYFNILRLETYTSFQVVLLTRRRATKTCHICGCVHSFPFSIDTWGIQHMYLRSRLRLIGSSTFQWHQTQPDWQHGSLRQATDSQGPLQVLVQRLIA